MTAIKTLTLADIGKPCEVRKFEGMNATVMWIGIHAEKDQPRVGVVRAACADACHGCAVACSDCSDACCGRAGASSGT
jgi:hypothetical protein